MHRLRGNVRTTNDGEGDSIIVQNKTKQNLPFSTLGAPPLKKVRQRLARCPLGNMPDENWKFARSELEVAVGF
jgi:hypothetical protein